jgi:copper oxidase (laccase) domain-containing protein
MPKKINISKYKKTIKFFNIFACIIFLQSLTACTSKENIKPKKTLINSDDDKQNVNIETENKKHRASSLIIDHKCIACGRCSMTDPEHFTQYSRTSQAIV